MERCRNYRKRILMISQNVQALHIAPAFSCVEILDFLYNDLMKGDPRGSSTNFILSKGHGAIGLYVVLESLGILTSEDIDQYCRAQGFLGAHPDRGNPGIISSTGSLGHGIGLAVGMAKGEKLKQNQRTVNVLVSDGELQEGSSWESIMMAANLELDNLIVVVDLNDFGGMDQMSAYHPSFYPLDSKFKSFGFEVQSCDGHDNGAISRVYKSMNSKKPKCIICHTVKGKGVSYMENAPIWHYRSPNQEELKQALSELDKNYA